MVSLVHEHSLLSDSSETLLLNALLLSVFDPSPFQPGFFKMRSRLGSYVVLDEIFVDQEEGQMDRMGLCPKVLRFNAPAFARNLAQGAYMFLEYKITGAVDVLLCEQLGLRVDAIAITAIAASIAPLTELFRFRASAAQLPVLV